MTNVAEILCFMEEIKLSYEYHGDNNLLIKGFSSLMNLKPNTITWLKEPNPEKLHTIPMDSNVLIVTKPSNHHKTSKFNMIFCDDPKAVYFSILKHFWARVENAGIAETAVIESTKIGQNVSIGNHCYIGPDVEIDDEVRIYHNVVILGKVTIGKRTIINSGTVIGSDGFGYFKNSDGSNVRVEHFGGVVIGNDVEIGANTCIDRGTLDNTIIGDNCKIDNLCHIGHNCILEEGVLLIALSQLGGSSHLKRQAHIAPSVTIMNQTSIGENSLVGLGSVVTKDVPDNKVVIGVPAKVIRDNK